jgi:hypothetical protein
VGQRREILKLQSAVRRHTQCATEVSGDSAVRRDKNVAIGGSQGDCAASSALLVTPPVPNAILSTAAVSGVEVGSRPRAPAFDRRRRRNCKGEYALA